MFPIPLPLQASLEPACFKAQEVVMPCGHLFSDPFWFLLPQRMEVVLQGGKAQSAVRCSAAEGPNLRLPGPDP